MTYKLIITRESSGRTIERNCDTRAELSEVIDYHLTRFRKDAGWNYTVVCEVIKRFTLLDSDVTSGNETQEKLWAFVQTHS